MPITHFDQGLLEAVCVCLRARRNPVTFNKSALSMRFAQALT